MISSRNSVMSLFICVHLLYLFNLAYSLECPKSFQCGDLGPLEFPLSNMQPDCGLFMVNCTNTTVPSVQFQFGENSWYDILQKKSPNSLYIRNNLLESLLANSSCFSFFNQSLPNSPSASFTILSNLTLFLCYNNSSDGLIDEYFHNYSFHNCSSDFIVYYRNPSSPVVINGGRPIPERCSMIQMPLNALNQDSDDVFEMIASEFTIEWNISQNCTDCHTRGGQCTTNNMNEYLCKIDISTLDAERSARDEERRRGQKIVILVTVLTGGSVLVFICLVIAILHWRRKKRMDGSYLLSRNISSETSSKADVEDGSFRYGIPLFCYTELEEATNNFDPSKELGDGGFGTVYHGVLKDGRQVAIKRLYEHNYKRVEQFMNEINILTCLKHPNLVTLYGCTSRRSRELLLVYEYISNGTVADHLHGEKAKQSLLTWPIRMNIAIDTASALTYLHKSDIVHRDVKTNNILLDSNFCVKVADFGLSRLFPMDVTHISTAPQGTPGYVDPEYHQCYQLTDKSDVYSFGVVLIELISSMPAVDITRRRQEINLANLALNRIQRCAFDELLDPSLGYKSDSEVMRMTTLVAELAFRCLQLEKDLRPSMDEVLSFLKQIQKGGDIKFVKKPLSPEKDDVVLLKKNTYQSSPKSVTDTWSSASTLTSYNG